LDPYKILEAARDIVISTGQEPFLKSTESETLYYQKYVEMWHFNYRSWCFLVNTSGIRICALGVCSTELGINTNTTGTCGCITTSTDGHSISSTTGSNIGSSAGASTNAEKA
jgi:hypothetical protein